MEMEQILGVHVDQHVKTPGITLIQTQKKIQFARVEIVKGAENA